MIRTFLEPFVLSLAVIVGLITIAHAFGKLPDYIRAADSITQALSRMGRGYLLQIPTFVSYVLPIAMLIGAAYGISQVTSKNEFTAISACGVSLWRILAPIYAVAVLVAFLGMANRELLMPKLEQISAREIQRWTGKEDDFRRAIIIKPEENTTFTLLYNLATGEVRSFTITHRETADYFRAASAEYTGGEWRLKDVIHGDRKIPEMQWKTSLTPREIEFMLMDPRVAPLNILKQLIRRYPENPQYLLLYHDRLSYPFTGIVLLGLGIPFIIGNERIRRSRMLGIGLCLLICGVFYTVWFIAGDLGQTSTPDARRLMPAAIRNSHTTAHLQPGFPLLSQRPPVNRVPTKQHAMSKKLNTPNATNIRPLPYMAVQPFSQRRVTCIHTSKRKPSAQGPVFAYSPLSRHAARERA